MILTTAEYAARLNYRPFGFDMAQTVASWWYSPGSPAMVALVTRRIVVAGLEEEVDHELRSRGLSGADRADLERLAAWVRDQPIVIITSEREAEAREELIMLLDEMTAAAG